MVELSVTIKMANYIAHPFWPAKNLCIDIEKTSGVNRQKSDDKRKAALEAECSKRGITYDDYQAARKEAARQWYTNAAGKIIIPRHQMAGAIVQTIGGSPKALRGGFDKDNFRALVQMGDFVTERETPDGVFGRFVSLEGSNQRSWQENEYIGRYLDSGEPFVAKGMMVVLDKKSEATAKALFAKAVEGTGVGAARRMGFGRGKVLSFK